MALAAASLLFVAAMVHAAITDIRRHRVLNKTVIALVAAFVPLAALSGLGWIAIAASVIAAILVFVIGFAAFCAGWLGGGDVKLAAVATLWIGAGLVVPFLAIAAVASAALAVAALALRRWQEGVHHPLGQIPYSPGIVAAALVLFPVSQWFQPA